LSHTAKNTDILIVDWAIDKDEFPAFDTEVAERFLEAFDVALVDVCDAVVPADILVLRKGWQDCGICAHNVTS
jgi:hypothetical protein